MRTDDDIKRDVDYELMWDPDIDPSDIGVAVRDGAVTSSGFARSFRQRRKAEDNATRVRGVRGSANDLEVRLPLINKRPDPEIVREIIAELKAEVPYAAEDIKTVVRDGHVTLKGEVEWDYQRRRAADTALRVSGVTGLTNEIEINPKVEPEDLKRKIDDALKRNAEVDAQHSTSRSRPKAIRSSCAVETHASPR